MAAEVQQKETKMNTRVPTLRVFRGYLSRQENARKLLNDTLFQTTNTINHTICRLDLAFRSQTVNRVSFSSSYDTVLIDRSLVNDLFRLDA